MTLAEKDAPQMPVDVLIEDSRWEKAGLEDLAGRAAAAALQGCGLEPAAFVISVLGCSDSRIATLNADFRGKPQATNVLSWPAEELGAETDGDAPAPPPAGNPADPHELGDIAIAFETCTREADAGGLTLKAHVTHLLVHGALHLLGYDHERDADATLMEGIETQILGKLGIDDPYSPDQDE